MSANLEKEGSSWPKEMIRDLIEGRLDSETLKLVQTRPKDEDRFRKVLEVEQDRMTWKEKIILPLQEHLYVVLKGKERVVKCSCGYEFGDYRENWKLSALVYERGPHAGSLERSALAAGADPQDGEIFRGPQGADPGWMILREFYCPGCATQLDVECVCPGHPIVFNQQPDIDGFYDLHPALKRYIF